MGIPRQHCRQLKPLKNLQDFLSFIISVSDFFVLKKAVLALFNTFSETEQGLLRRRKPSLR